LNRVRYAQEASVSSIFPPSHRQFQILDTLPSQRSRPWLRIGIPFAAGFMCIFAMTQLSGQGTEPTAIVEASAPPAAKKMAPTSATRPQGFAARKQLTIPGGTTGQAEVPLTPPVTPGAELLGGDGSSTADVTPSSVKTHPAAAIPTEVTGSITPASVDSTGDEVPKRDVVRRMTPLRESSSDRPTPAGRPFEPRSKTARNNPSRRFHRRASIQPAKRDARPSQSTTDRRVADRRGLTRRASSSDGFRLVSSRRLSGGRRLTVYRKDLRWRGDDRFRLVSAQHLPDGRRLTVYRKSGL
jgi:hypothetical protein